MSKAMRELVKVRASLLTSKLISGDKFPEKANSVLKDIDETLKPRMAAEDWRHMVKTDEYRARSMSGMVKSEKIKFSPETNLSNKIQNAVNLITSVCNIHSLVLA